MYRDAKLLNEKGVMTWLVTEEHPILTGSFPTVPEMHKLFDLHKCDCMARDMDNYCDEIVREFYASYVATIHVSINK